MKLNKNKYYLLPPPQLPTRPLDECREKYLSYRLTPCKYFHGGRNSTYEIFISRRNAENYSKDCEKIKIEK